MAVPGVFSLGLGNGSTELPLTPLPPMGAGTPDGDVDPAEVGLVVGEGVARTAS